MRHDIMVSVVCLTFNHKKYIHDALKGFVTQKTDFKFEVIVHDDASNDGTTQIIRAYEKKYPEIIKPIYQKENQYSKSINILNAFIKEKINGKYIALCEGDDYWCSQNKLQMQVDFMENNLEYSGCGHRHYMLNCKSGKRTVHNNMEIDCDVDKNLIMDWNGLQFHTSSYLFRKEYFCVPASFMMKEVGNYPLLVWIALHGKIYQFAEVMSVYRFLADGSWSVKNTSKHMLENRKKMVNDSITMLREAEKFAKQDDYEIIANAISKYEIEKVSLEGAFFKLITQYRKDLKKVTLRKRVVFFLCSLSPQICYYIKYRKG